MSHLHHGPRRPASSPGPATGGQPWTCWSSSIVPRPAARAEDFVVPRLDALGPMMAEPREAWQGGPYARRAGEFLQAHAAGLACW